MDSYVLGVDGGGTKTEVVLVDCNGNVIARTRGGSTNYQAVGGKQLKKEMLSLFSNLLAKTGISSTKILSAFVGLAGAGRKSDQDAIRALFDDTDYKGKIVVDSDAVIALAGAFGGLPGIILIAGTGSICFGKSADGTVVRSGGWGYLLGDEGSGYFIGRKAIMAALKDHDGRGKKTALKKKLMGLYELASIDEIIPRIYQNKLDRVAIANLAPLVFDLAKKDDDVAQQIIKQTGNELGKLAHAVAKNLGFANKKIRVALIGSIFKQRDILVNEISKELVEISRDIEITDAKFDPATGAAIIAFDRAKIEVNDSILQNLENSTGIIIN